MPVLSDENNKVIGIITISDLVKLYGTEADKIMKLRNRPNVNIDLSDNEINNNKEKHHTQDKATK
jgi:CBS domain-containing protein